MKPIMGVRYHCTVCEDFDLCESCEAKGFHPRNHPLVKLQVPRNQPAVDEDAVHRGVSCDVCKQCPITGLRYKCTVCPDFDMCESCEGKREHPADHPLIQLRTERHLPQVLPPFFRGEGAESEASRGGRCPRRGGWRRCVAAAAAAAAAAASSATAASCASSSAPSCPKTASGPCGPCGPCGPREESEGVSCGPCEPDAPVQKGPQATLLRHVTLAHGSKLEQGYVLVKTWSVQNNGQEAWPETSKLIFLRGDRELLGETEEFSVVVAKPGQTVEVSVPIMTPTKPGNYTAYFQLADDSRRVFGPRLWLEVTVTRDEEDERKLNPTLPVVSSSSSPSLSSTVAPTIDTSGWVDIKVETAPTSTPAPAPVTAAAPAIAVPVVVAPKPTPVVPVAPKPVKYESQLASLAAMGFKNTELNAFMLEKHNGDIGMVTNWLLENMNH